MTTLSITIPLDWSAVVGDLVVARPQPHEALDIAKQYSRLDSMPPFVNPAVENSLQAKTA